MEVFVKAQNPYKPGSYTLKTFAGIRSVNGIDLSNDMIVDFTAEENDLPGEISITPPGAQITPGRMIRFSASFSDGDTKSGFLRKYI